ncbi:MAG: hypothetical protein ACFHU9_02460 [Fluviicola sp.]
MMQIKKLSFKKRPIPVPGDYRPLYKISLILLILKINGRGGKASLLKIHLFLWALKSQANMEIVQEHIQMPEFGLLNFWGMEPAATRALKFAVSENLCAISSGKYTITSKGEEFVKKILSDKELLIDERDFLNAIGKSHLTEAHIGEITKKWKLND